MSTQPARKSLKACIRHLTPAWHTIIMGTGSLAGLASRFYLGQGSEAIKVITLLLFFINLCSFVLVCAASFARYYMFPELWSAMIKHPTQSLYLGAFPMGAATLINSALVAHETYGFSGLGFLYTLWAFWWLDSAISFVTAVGMLNVMMTKHRHSLDQMSPLWLLPVVSLIVASSTGGLLAAALPAHGVFVPLTTAISFIMLLIGISLAFMIITIWLMRLIINGPPDPTLIMSSFVPLGPLGQGGFSFIINSHNLTRIHLGSTISASTIESVCFCVAWLFWSMGIVWFCLSVCSVYIVFRRQRVPFGVGWWGTIFPNGVFALLTVELGVILESPAMSYIGAIYSLLLLLLWILVVARTIPAIWNTTVFNSPCVTKLDQETLTSFELTQ